MRRDAKFGRKRPPAPNAPPLGRPAILTDGQRVNVYLDAQTLDRARELGEGNVSEGIRRALAVTA